MPTTLLLGKNHEIQEWKTRLKSRKRTFGGCMAMMSVSLFAGAFCISFAEAGHSSFVYSFLAVTGLCLFCSAMVFAGAGIYIGTLNRCDLKALLNSDLVTAVPILAEYHEYLRSNKSNHHTYRTIRELPIIRAHIIELLRADGAASELESSEVGIMGLIKMMADVPSPDDLALLIKLIARVASSGYLAQLDAVVKKLCEGRFKADNRAKHDLILQVAECKSAIRARQSRIKEAKSLLRASDAPDILLRPAYSQPHKEDAEHLLHASHSTTEP